MKYCGKCKVHVTGSRHYCPLCQNELEGEAETEKEIFPELEPPKTPFRSLIRIMLFISIAAGAICVAVNLSLRGTGWWSLIVLGGLGTLWAALMVLIKKRKNILKNIIWQLIIITILSLATDIATGFHGWSVDFVIPIFCTLAMAAMYIISKILKIRIEDFIIFVIIDGIFGIIQLILLLTNIIRIPYPSVICFAVSVISLAGLFIFAGEAMRAEIYRRTHM